MDDTKEPLHFKELGPLVLEKIFSPERLRLQVEQVIGADPIDLVDSAASGRVKVTLGEIRRSIRACEIAFAVPLLLSIEFTLPLLGESYQGTATLELRLSARTFEPGILQILVRRVRDDDIRFDAQVVAGLGIASLGPQWRVIERLVRSGIRSHIERRIEATGSSRRFYLPAVALEATGASPEPATSHGNEASTPPASDGATLRGRLEPGASHDYSLVLGRGEEVRFDIYTSSTAEQVTMRASATLYDTVGSKIEDSELRMSTDRAWNGEYAVQPLVFASPATGVYKLRLRNEERASDRGIEYIIRQERHPAKAGQRLCFPAFGRVFMRSVVSPPVIEGRLRRLLPAEQSFGPFAPLPLVQAEGLARITLLSVEEEQKPAEQDHELTFRARLRIDPQVRITFLGSQEVWHLRTAVTLRLRAYAVRDPLSIVVEPDQVKASSVRVLGAACVEGDGRFNQLNLLTRAIGRILAGQISVLLVDTEKERVIDLEPLVAASLDKRAALAVPADNGMEPLRLVQGLDGMAVASKPPVYWKIRLARRQKIRLGARWRLSGRPRRPVQMSLGICDENMGLLKSSEVATGDTGKVGHARLTLTAPRPGDYFIRLAMQARAGDESLRVDYQLKVMA